MIQKLGGRKTVWLTESLIAFCLILLKLEITESNAVLAVAGGISLLLGSAIFGNVKEHQANGKQTHP